MSRSWNDVQSKATRAAMGAGVPPAQALAFGAMAARHLADGGDEGALGACLNTPAQIVVLAGQIEELVEAASISQGPVQLAPADKDRDLLMSWARSLPCQCDAQSDDTGLAFTLALTQPSRLARPDRVRVGDALWAAMDALAIQTYVPDSAASQAFGAGAGLMDID